jgi:hypothetical protein
MIEGIFNNLIPNISLGGNNSNSAGTTQDNIEQIGDNVFKFNVFLNNGTSKVGLKFSAIEEFNIIDDLRYFYVYGTLTFNYNEDALESFESLKTGLGGNSKDSEPYQFRGDGRDLLEIDIMPQLKEEQCLEVYATENDKKKYNIKHICSIYKYEDITSGKGEKKRKLYFWDRDYQILNELNINYSTADKTKNTLSFFNAGSQNVPISKSNTDTSLNTGDIIEGILQKSLVEISSLTFKKGPWDKGFSKINYYSPSTSRAIDDLNYILKYHTSDQSNSFMPCILKKERYTDKYNLIPINKYFKGSVGFNLLGSGMTLGAGPDVIEDFVIGKLEMGDSDSSPLSRGLRGGSGKINLSDYNLIEDYTFVRVDANDLQKYMTTYMVHGNDPRGFFNSNLKDNTFKNSSKVYEEVFVKNNVGGPGNSPTSNLPKNKLREKYHNVNHVLVPYALDDKQAKNFGINTGLKNMFFKNSSIEFKARGNTLRQTGKFFTVNRTDSNVSESYDNTVLGKYMITYIRHEFKSGSYDNLILGVKPYSYKAPNFRDSI